MGICHHKGFVWIAIVLQVLSHKNAGMPCKIVNIKFPERLRDNKFFSFLDVILKTHATKY